MTDLYDEDILLWSERQASLLRRLAAGERVNDTDLDWTNISEEIEAMGRGELRACESLLMQAVVHRIKQACWPDSSEVPHWHEEEIRRRVLAIHAPEDRSGPGPSPRDATVAEVNRWRAAPAGP